MGFPNPVTLSGRSYRDHLVWRNCVRRGERDCGRDEQCKEFHCVT